MKYDMLSRETAHRIWDTFAGHPIIINEKYRSFVSEDNYWYSDRDRMVGRMEKLFKGRYFVLADKELFAINYNGYLYTVDRKSVFASGKRDGYMQGDPVYRRMKRYLVIVGVRAVNEMYGHGFVEMSCMDVFDNQFGIRLDQSTLEAIQFKEIGKDEFESVKQLFADDRDEMQFKVTRYLTWDEIKKKKKTRCKGPVKDTVIVTARDHQEAGEKVVNAVDAELIHLG